MTTGRGRCSRLSTNHTAVVALPHCHWTDGGLLDLVAIGARCREAGATLVLDLTQSAGALCFDVAAVRPDYVVCAGYKWLLGPYSLGFLWVAPEHRRGKPIEYNWIGRARAEDFARLVDYRDEYQPGARRFDVGERSNFILVPMLNAALEQILEWGVEAIETTLAARTADITVRAARLGLGSAPAELRAGHFLGLRFPDGGLPAGLLDALAAERVYVSVRGSSMRVTPHLYNTDEDVGRLFAALRPRLRLTPCLIFGSSGNRTMGRSTPGSRPAGLPREPQQILAIAVLAQLVTDRGQRFEADPAVQEGDLLGNRDALILTLLDRANEPGGFREAVVRSGVEPGEPAAQPLHVEVFSFQITPVDVGDLQLPRDRSAGCPQRCGRRRCRRSRGPSPPSGSEDGRASLRWR